MMKPPTVDETPQKPIIPAPEAVLARALKRLQMICKGNGAKDNEIKFVESKAQIYEFPARTLVRLNTLVGTRTVPGKVVKGEMIGSPAAFQGALQSIVASAKNDPATRKSIIDMVVGRPDKGFAARDQKIDFTHLTRDFVSHETCSSCTGQGKMTCHSCGGRGQTTCGNCQGRSHVLCPQCRGSSHIMQNGKRTPCPRCKAKGRIPCPVCGARGMMACQTCKGSTQLSCQKCNGTGSLSHLAHVTVEGHLHFDFERQGIPLQVTKRIDAFGSRHAAQKDFEITLYNLHDNADNANEPPDMLAIDYDVKIPHGPAVFSIKGKTLTGTIFGYRGEIIEAPPFLHELTRGGQNALVAAAEHPAKSSEGIKFAARYRLLRDVIMLATKNTEQRAALATLQKKYPFGVAAEQLLQWFIAAQNALRHLTRRPRYVGMAIGVFVSLALVAASVFAGGRYFIFARAGLSTPMILAVDISHWLLAFLVTSLCASWFASHQIRSTLANFASADTLAQFLPVSGKTNMYAVILSFLIILTVYGFAFTAHKLPEYETLLRSIFS